MKLIQSPWVAVLAAIVVFAGTLFYTWPKEQFIRPAPVRARAMPPPISAGPSWAFNNPELEQMVAEIHEERATLAQKETELKEFEKRLQIERAEITQVTQTVARLQAEFNQNVTRIKQEEVVNLKRLAKTYVEMSPDSSASVLHEMDDPSVVKILAFMKETEVAPILEALAKLDTHDPSKVSGPKRVAQLSERLKLSLKDPEKPK